MFFAALSGSGPATTAAIGSITIPAMLEEKYKPRFAGAVAAAAGALGSMIPPSNLLIIYALVQRPVHPAPLPGRHRSGPVPGPPAAPDHLLHRPQKRGYGEILGDNFSWRLLVLRRLWEGKWALGAPTIILGGIYSGIFTPSEAAGVAVFYGL